MKDLIKRKGKISINHKFITEETEIVSQALSGAVIFRTEYDVFKGVVNYELCHPAFDILAEGKALPNYDCMITRKPDDSFLFNFCITPDKSSYKFKFFLGQLVQFKIGDDKRKFKIKARTEFNYDTSCTYQITPISKEGNTFQNDVSGQWIDEYDLELAKMENSKGGFDALL